MIPGFAGAIASMVVVWPTEVIKYHKQLSQESYYAIVKKLWPRGYYTGFAASSISVIPANALPMIMMEPCGRVIGKYVSNQSLASFISSLTISSIVSVTTIPLVNVSVRKVVYPHEESTSYFLRAPRELVKGLDAYYIKNITRIGVKLMCYDIIRDRCTFTHDWRDAAIAGGIATSISAIASNPVDVALTRQQTSYGKRMSLIHALTYDMGVSGYLKRVFAGVTIRTMRGIPGGMVMFGVMEYTKRLMDV